MNVARHYSGVLISGDDIGIELVPSISGKILVSVIGYPPLTGFKEACRLGRESAQSEFGLGGIQIVGARMDCLQSDDYAPLYREGFSLVLEVGMADAIRSYLPRLARVATVAAAIERRIATLMEPAPYQHMSEFITSTVALIVLDGQRADEAVRCQAALHWAGKDAAYMAAFEDDQVQHLLHSALPPEPAVPPLSDTTRRK